MLSFFKSNNPGVVIFYVLYLAAFRVFAFYTQVDTTYVFSHDEPLSKLFFGLFKNAGNSYAVLSLSLSALLCFIQALLINYIVNENKILSKKNYLAGLLFIIFFSFFKESLYLTPASLSLTFLILCTAKIFSLIKKEKALGDIFDVGFLVAIAGLFYFPATLFIIFAYIGLATVRPFTYREWIIVLMGFLSPFVLLFTYYFWNDRTHLLLADIANADGKAWLTGLHIMPADWVLLGGLALVILACFVLLPTAMYSSLIQVRKFSTTLVVLILLIAVAFILQQRVNQGHWVLLSLPLAIIFSIVMMQIKSRWISEVVHLILILLVLTGQYFFLFNQH